MTVYAAFPPKLVVVSVPFAKGVLAADAPLTVYDAGCSGVRVRWNAGLGTSASM